MSCRIKNVEDCLVQLVVVEVHQGDRDTVRGEHGVKPHILFNFTIDLAALTDFTASTVSRVNTFDQEASPLCDEI